ncbi:MAG: hypothetical protein ACI9MB_001604, partial [Verrucomicrobiales bacterium]
MNNLSSKELRRAADLLEKIEAAESELEALLSGKPIKNIPGRKPGRKPGSPKAGPKPKPKKTATKK